MKDKFYIFAKRRKNSRFCYEETRWHEGSALRLANKYIKRGWYNVSVIHDASNNIIYTYRG